MVQRTGARGLLGVWVVAALLLASCTQGSPGSEEDFDPGATGSPTLKDGGGCGSSGAEAASGTSPSSAQLGDSNPAFSGFQSVIEGVASGAEDATGAQLQGWALSALGIGGDDAMSEVASELGKIDDDLQQVCNDLNAINQAIELLTCSSDANTASTPAADIDTLFNEYTDFMYEATNLNDAPSAAKLTAWAGSVLNGDSQTSSVLKAATDLADVGLGSSSGGGIADCVKSATTSVGGPPDGTLDDRPYYDNVVGPVVNWYYGYVAKAYVMIAEASHIQAWVDSGSPTGSGSELTDTIDSICTPGGSGSASPSGSPSPSATSSPSGNVNDDCSTPLAVFQEQVIPWLTQFIQAGGAPYSTDELVITNGYPADGNANFLIVTSLEAYTKAAGGDCPTPLTTPDQCGPLSGPNVMTIPDIRYGQYGKGNGTWVEAVDNQFKWLLQGFGKLSSSGTDGATTAAGWLCTGVAGSTATKDCARPTGASAKDNIDGAAGLEYANKIILFPSQTKSDLGVSGVGPGLGVWCFFDGSIVRNHASNVFCSGGENYEVLISGPADHDESTCAKTVKNGYLDGTFSKASWITGTGPVSGGGFYSGFACNYVTSDSDDKPEEAYLRWSSAPPMWSTSSTPVGYHWPVLEWTGLTCTDALSSGLKGKSATQARNPAGVPTMCGDDFGAYLLDALPQTGPESSGGSTG